MRKESRNKQLQNLEEDTVRHLLSIFLQIPYSSIKKRESPDCLVTLNGKNVGIEITTMRPSMLVTATTINSIGQNKNAIECVIKEICYNCMQKYEIYDISIRFRLNLDLYYTRYNIKDKKKFLVEVVDGIFKNLQKDIVSETQEKYKIKRYAYSYEEFANITFEYCPYAGWKSIFMKDKTKINIYFTYQGFLFPIPFEYVKSFILKKEKKLESYKKNNQNIDEMWLCLYLPREEFGFSIKGIEVPLNYKTAYDRVILVQDFPHFARDL